MGPNQFLQPSLEIKNDKMIVKGTIIFETVAAVSQQGIESIRQMKDIQVDLGQLVKCDSSVLALCIAWARAAYLQKKNLVFLNTPEFMKDLIRVHGLEKVLPQT